ncbi:hypothetical protein M0802_001899 [Mischocyttarus mexicanus]|nr:hypothetical protein M0802_001899 [Mischocyttarus mexicanus]
MLYVSHFLKHQLFSHLLNLQVSKQTSKQAWKQGSPPTSSSSSPATTLKGHETALKSSQGLLSFVPRNLLACLLTCFDTFQS